MKNVIVIGASGYTGAQLVQLITQHPDFALQRVFVSQNSQDAGKKIGALHGSLAHLNITLEALLETQLESLAQSSDIIFLATPHEASHHWVKTLSGHRAVVLDLSGAFRLKNTQVFSQYYGFKHEYPDVLEQAVYGLAEWYEEQIASAKIIAVPGCYPTASLTALKPLMENQLLDTSMYPVINAISGVTGAGRKASLTTSFCEVSLNAYGVLGHRHTPEISAYLGNPVIFTPHLGNFKRGILATITVKLKSGVTKAMLDGAYSDAYQSQPLVRLREQFPKIDDVVHSPFADLHYAYQDDTQYAVITCAIDNLMKGAASQAIQCANLICGYPSARGLIL